MLDDPAEVIGACSAEVGIFAELDRSRRTRASQAASHRRQEIPARLSECRGAGPTGRRRHSYRRSCGLRLPRLPSKATRNLSFSYPARRFPALHRQRRDLEREQPAGAWRTTSSTYLLRPEVAAEIAIKTETATANGAALAKMPESLRSNKTLFPPPETLERGEWFAAMPPKLNSSATASGRKSNRPNSADSPKPENRAPGVSQRAESPARHALVRLCWLGSPGWRLGFVWGSARRLTTAALLLGFGGNQPEQKTYQQSFLRITRAQIK